MNDKAILTLNKMVISLFRYWLQKILRNLKKC